MASVPGDADRGEERWGDRVLDAVDQVADAVRERIQGAGRASGRDASAGVRGQVLRVLADGPNHGYAIIHELRRRDGRAPGAGEVYPELQLLADQGLADVRMVEGRRIFELTEAGRIEVERLTEPYGVGDLGAPTGRRGAGSSRAERIRDLTAAGVELGRTAALVARTGNDAQLADASAALAEARRALYTILSRE